MNENPGCPHLIMDIDGNMLNSTSVIKYSR